MDLALLKLNGAFPAMNMTMTYSASLSQDRRSQVDLNYLEYASP